MVFIESSKQETVHSKEILENDDKTEGSEDSNDAKEGKSFENDPGVRRQPVQPDGGWGWVVCLTATLNFVTVSGIIHSSSNFYVYFIEGFPAEDAKSFDTAWVTSILLGTTLLLGSLASVLSDRFGFQKVGFVGGLLASVGVLSSAFVSQLSLLYLTFGVLVGTGLSFCYTCSLNVLAHYFDKRLGLSHAIMMCGGGLISIGYTWAIPALYRSLGIKDTLLCCSGITALLMLYALTWKSIFHRQTGKPEDEGPGTGEAERGKDRLCSCCSRDKIHRWFNVRIWKNRQYVLWLISSTIAFFGFFVFNVHMVKFSEEKFPQVDSKILTTFWVGGMAAGRLILMPFADRSCVRKAYIWIHQAIFFVMGSVTMFVPFFPDSRWVIAASSICGACDGIYFVLIGPIAKQMVGVIDSSQALGFLFGAIAIPFASGPAVAGLLYDLLGAYPIVFHVFAIPLLVGGALLFISPCLRQERGRYVFGDRYSPTISSYTPTRKKSPVSDEPINFNMELTVVVS